MTLNPANGDRSTLVCEAVWGLGEPLVSGEVTPDRFVVDKVSGDVVRREIADEADAAGPRRGDGGTRVAEVPAELRDAPVPDRRRARRAAAHRPRRRARGGLSRRTASSRSTTDGVHLLQTRPETVWSRREPGRSRPAARRMGAVLATLTGAR